MKLQQMIIYMLVKGARLVLFILAGLVIVVWVELYHARVLMVGLQVAGAFARLL